MPHKATRFALLRPEVLLTLAVCVLAFLSFEHPDLWETSNHSWVLLDTIADGKFLDYYKVVAAHQNTLYYMNTANYNICTYLVFAVWQLPVWGVCRLVDIPVNEYALIYYSKAVPVLFLLLSVWALRRLALHLGLSAEDTHWLCLFFVLCAPVFFGCLVMGQYDSIGLFFCLLGLDGWVEGSLPRFTFWMGASAAFKFFPLLLFVPLLLLAEKRPLRLLGWGAAGLWLLAPSTLLFTGRIGHAGSFTTEMFARVLALRLAGVPVFPVLYALVLVLCWLYRPAPDNRSALGVYVCTAVYCLLFLCVAWHPQWLLLLMPFWLLCVFLQPRRALWLCLTAVWGAVFLVQSNLAFPAQMDCILFENGLLSRLAGGVSLGGVAYTSYAAVLGQLPLVAQLVPVFFAALLAAGLLILWPRGQQAAHPQRGLGILLWGGFVLGPVLCWFVPCLRLWLAAIQSL